MYLPKEKLIAKYTGRFPNTFPKDVIPNIEKAYRVVSGQTESRAATGWVFSHQFSVFSQTPFPGSLLTTENCRLLWTALARPPPPLITDGGPPFLMVSDSRSGADS